MSRANREAAMKACQADPDLSTGAKYLLFYIGDLVADGRKLEVGCDYLSEELGESRGSVRRWRTELAEAGYLVPDRVVKGGQRSNTYLLDLTPRESDNGPPTDRTTVHPQTVTDEPTVPQRSINGLTTDRVTVHQRSTPGPKQEQKRTGTGSSSSSDADLQSFGDVAVAVIEETEIEEAEVIEEESETHHTPGGIEYDDHVFRQWIEKEVVKRDDVRNPRAVARLKYTEDRAIFEASLDHGGLGHREIRRRRILAGETVTEPSPPRNDSAKCPHYALDTEGWCAACSTQVKEVTT